MGIALGDNINITAGLPTDCRYLNSTEPWSSVSEVNANIGSGIRYTGLTVNIQGTEYWYKEGIGDGDLVEKQTSGGGTITGGTNGLSTSGENIILGGTLTGNTTITSPSSACGLVVDGYKFCVCGTNMQASISGSSTLIINTSISRLGVGARNLNITSSCMTINDNDGNEGLVYGGDYSANGSSNPRWIPDVNWVTGNTGIGNVNWDGSTTNAIGTFVDSDTICAQPNLLFDGTTLQVSGLGAYCSMGAGGRLRLESGDGTNNIEHTGIRFISDVATRYAEIVNTRESSSYDMGFVFKTHIFGGSQTAMCINADGSVKMNKSATITGGPLTICDDNIPLRLYESDTGCWARMVYDAGSIRYDYSTSGGDAFTTVESPLCLQQGGSVFLRHAGATKLCTVGDGVRVVDNLCATATVYANTYFSSTDSAAVFGTNSTGIVYLRPDDINTTTNQSQFSTTLASIGTDMQVLGCVCACGTNFCTGSNTTPVRISRAGSDTQEVLSIGVIDTITYFTYIEDTTSEGTGNFGTYEFQLGGNNGETTCTPLCIEKTNVHIPECLRVNSTSTNNSRLVVEAATCDGAALFYGDNTSTGTNYGIRVFNKGGTSSGGNYGIWADAYYSAGPSTAGRSHGLWAVAGNKTDRYNYGVIGQLCGTQEGAGIVGVTAGWSTQLPSGTWAGVFEGNTYIGGDTCTTGNILFCQGGTRTICVSNATDGGNGDSLQLCAGNGYSDATPGCGGNVVIKAGCAGDGSSSTVNDGGYTIICGGCGGEPNGNYAGGAGGNAIVRGGAGAESYIGGKGGNALICASDGALGYSGGAGGDVIIRAGCGHDGSGGGAGSDGLIKLVGQTDQAISIYNTQDDNPYIAFYNANSVSRFGYIRACYTNSSYGMVFCNDGGNSIRIGSTYTCMLGPTCMCGTTCVYGITSGYYIRTNRCGCAIDWVATSDCRKKKNITPISNALSTIDCLCGVCYEFCEENTLDMGLIAQDVMKVEPRLVTTSEPNEEEREKFGIEDQTYGLKYDKFAGLFVEAIKELKLQNEKLEWQNKCLQNQINALRDKIY